MKITVIYDDKAVYKNGVCYKNIDFSTVPKDIHALQWDDENGAGWIEFGEGPDGVKLAPNKAISELPDWVNTLISLWEEADNAAAIQAKKQAEMLEKIKLHLAQNQNPLA